MMSEEIKCYHCGKIIMSNKQIQIEREKWIKVVEKLKKERIEKIGLQGGYCGGRHTCKNLNKKCCNPKPESNQNYVKCSHYEPKKEDFRIMSNKQIQNLVKEKVEIEREKWIKVVEKLKKERIEKRRAIIRKHLVVEGMKVKDYIIDKKYRITVNAIICGEWLDETTSFIGIYKGEGNFEDEKGNWYNASVVEVKEL